MPKKNTDIATRASQELIDQINASFPQEENRSSSISLPRIGMFSQDQTTGKGKAMTVTNEAGEFYIEVQTNEVDENGKKVWGKEIIGTEFEGIIFYKRRQLKMYDEDTGEYTSSPVYDSADEVVPLFCNKNKVAEGTPDELKKKYIGTKTTKAGKPKSDLEETIVLYVLKDGEAHQMNLRGSSMYAFLDYAKVIKPASVVTQFFSMFNENGAVQWNSTTFTKVRDISEEEAMQVLALQSDMNEFIKAKREQFSKGDALKVEIVQDETKDF